LRSASSQRFCFARAPDCRSASSSLQVRCSSAAIVSVQADSGVTLKLRQSKYLNNLVEQDHRAIKRIVRPMQGFKSFACARILIAGIETMHMIRKGQLEPLKEQDSSAADQFYSLAF
jgi:putative transposase